MWQEIKKIIKNCNNIVLTTHVNPDGDGIGSACALTELLLYKGKNVRFVCHDPIPQKFTFLDYHSTHELYNSQKNYKDTQLVIILDTNKRERIGDVASLLDIPGVVTLCIDHHEVSAVFTDYQITDPQACSVGAMLYSLYKESGVPFNIKAATGIYTSVVCDTGRFCYRSTSRKAHKIAEECIHLGVDPDKMHSRLFQHVSLSESQLFAKILLEMEMHLDNRVAIQQIHKSDCEKFGIIDFEHLDLEYIHDFNNLIEGVECFVLLRELDDSNVRVSLRSRNNLDISKVVRLLGGGGHVNAAGVTWHGSLTEIKKKILTLLENEFNQRAFSEDLREFNVLVTNL